MEDRELLEWAAKAAGLGDVWTLPDHPETFYVGPPYALGQPVRYSVWNPLIDDGDALRLAVRLGIGVGRPHQSFRHTRKAFLSDVIVFSVNDEDIYAATRRAIVRAAAEVGRRIE